MDMRTRTLLGIVVGLLVSLLITFIGYTCSQLANKGVYAPFSQCLLFYLLLAFVYGGLMIYEGPPPQIGQPPLKAKPYYYIIRTLFDAFSKVFVIKGFQHTSLTSAMLLDGWMVPFVFALAWLFFKKDYGFQKPGFQKLVGWTICVAGLVAVVLSDVHSADRSSGINPLRGDLLIIVGATFCGVATMIEVVFLKGSDIMEVFTFLGFYGAILSASLIVINERNELKSILSSPGTMFLFIGYSLAMFLVYSGIPFLCWIGGSRMANLWLFTSCMWAALIQIFVYHEKVDWIYFVCFAAFYLGYMVYSRDCTRDPNNGDPATIDEPLLHNLDNDGISNDDGSSTSVQGARNLLCSISCVVKIQIWGNVKSDVKSSMVISKFASKSGEWIV